MLDKPSEQKRLLRKEKADRIQPNRLAKKSKVEETIEAVSSGRVEKRGRGRPKKANLAKFSLKTVLAVFITLFHLFVEMYACLIKRRL
jgi:hypothetical protein